MDHRLTQLLGAGLPGASLDRDSVCGSIVLDDRRMLHRYVGGALLEVLGDGIPTVVHHLLNELISFADSTHRLIYEVTLSRRPLLQIVLPGAGVKTPDLELANPPPAIGQLFLGGTLVAALSDDAPVLRPNPSFNFRDGW